MSKHVTHRSAAEAKGGELEKGAAEQCLSTAYTLWPICVQMNRSVTKRWAAKTQTEDDKRFFVFVQHFVVGSIRICTQNKEIQLKSNKNYGEDPSLGYDLTSFDITSLAGGWAVSS